MSWLVLVSHMLDRGWKTPGVLLHHVVHRTEEEEDAYDVQPQCLELQLCSTTVWS